MPNFGRNLSLKYTDPSGHSVECGLGDPYCGVGKLDVGRRAVDLARTLGKKGNHYNELTQQKSILDEGGIVSEAYYNAQQIEPGPIRQWLDDNLASDGRTSPNVPDPL